MKIISMVDVYNRRLPKVGDVLPIFDDGKCRPSRLEIGKVIEVLPFEEGLRKKMEMIDFKCVDVDRTSFGFFPLKDAWEDAYNECDWIFNPTTDYFIFIEKDDDYEPIEVFARTTDGGWFSFPVKSHMTGGRLDSDMSLFNSWKDSDLEYYSSVYYEEIDKFNITA